VRTFGLSLLHRRRFCPLKLLMTFCPTPRCNNEQIIVTGRPVFLATEDFVRLVQMHMVKHRGYSGADARKAINNYFSQERQYRKAEMLKYIVSQKSTQRIFQLLWDNEKYDLWIIDRPAPITADSTEAMKKDFVAEFGPLIREALEVRKKPVRFNVVVVFSLIRSSFPTFQRPGESPGPGTSASPRRCNPYQPGRSESRNRDMNFPLSCLAVTDVVCRRERERERCTGRK